VDVVLGASARRNVVQPDVLFVSNERMGIVTRTEVVGAPDLSVEILSPGTAYRDRSQKKALHARNRVREYWTVDVELDLQPTRCQGRPPQGLATARRLQQLPFDGPTC
jgi:Uma2 family endonuclease